MKILIAGATGHLGSEMVKACQARGHYVHVWVRPESRRDAAKMKPLQAAGATIHQGELDDYDRLLSVCKTVDCALSALDVTSADEGALVRAVKDAGLQRFIPSGFGIDPAVTAPGSCVVFDVKSALQRSVKEAGIPYTFVHANGFFSHWVFTLGDMTNLGRELPPAEASVYGDGNVKGSFVSVPDVAAVTVRALNDPRLENREIRIDANRMTQNELVELWQGMGGSSVKRVEVAAADLEQIIDASTAPGERMVLALAQLHRSMWIRGEAVKRSPIAMDAADLYPELEFQTVEEGLTTLL